MVSNSNEGVPLTSASDVNERQSEHSAIMDEISAPSAEDRNVTNASKVTLPKEMSHPQKSTNLSETPSSFHKLATDEKNQIPSMGESRSVVKNINDPGRSNSESFSPVSAQTESPSRSNSDSSIRHIRALNIALENIFQVSLKKGCEAPLKYIGDSFSENLFTSANISEAICTRLSQDSVLGGAIGYLIGCYKRLYTKEQSANEQMSKDLTL